jgi:hypothetical protein
MLSEEWDEIETQRQNEIMDECERSKTPQDLEWQIVQMKEYENETKIKESKWKTLLDDFQHS